MNYKRAENGKWYVDQRINGVRCMLRADTKKELIEKVKVWEEKQQTISARKQFGPTFEEVAHSWWHKTCTEIRHGTVRCYRPSMNYWVREYGNMRIKDFDTYLVTNAFDRLAKMGYSKKTIGNYRIVLNNIFMHWINSEWHGTFNPVRDSMMPKRAKKSQEREPPTENEMAVVLAHPEGFGFVASFLAYTGMRIGEANAIQVKDIDLDEMCYGVRGCINVTKAAPWAGNRPYIEQPKTDAGVRKIPIFSPFRPIIMARIKDLAADDYVLSMCSEPLTQSAYTHNWAEYMSTLGLTHERVERTNRRLKNGDFMCRKVKVANVTAHQFRHYMATACYIAKVPELAASKILGHASIETTRRVYTHIRNILMNESVESLEELFKKCTNV